MLTETWEAWAHFATSGGGGGGGCGSRVIFWEVGEGGWCKRKNLQISDVQRLASLEQFDRFSS